MFLQVSHVARNPRAGKHSIGGRVTQRTVDAWALLPILIIWGRGLAWGGLFSCTQCSHWALNHDIPVIGSNMAYKCDGFYKNKYLPNPSPIQKSTTFHALKTILFLNMKCSARAQNHEPEAPIIIYYVKIAIFWSGYSSPQKTKK